MLSLLSWLRRLRRGSGHAPVSTCGIVLQDGYLVAAQISEGEAGRPVILGHASVPAAAGDELVALRHLGGMLDLTGATLCWALSSAQYRFQLIELPNVPANELKQALSWRLSELFADHHEQQAPNAENFTFDFLPLPAAQAGMLPTQALVFGVPNRVLQPIQLACHEASLALNVVDAAALAQRNLSALAEVEGQGLAVLSLNDAGGLLTITQGGELYLVRHLETSLPQLLRADDTGRQILLERIALDLQRSFDVFDRQYRTAQLSSLQLAPMPALPGLLQSLRQNLFVPVEWFDLPGLFDLPTEPPPNRMWTALGAALRTRVRGF